MAEQVFNLISEGIRADPSIVQKVGGIIQFNIDGQIWVINLKNAPGVTKGESTSEVTITISEPDFLLLMKGQLNAQQAFLGGKLKLKGNMMLAMKLSALVETLNKPQTAVTVPAQPQQVTAESVFSEIQKHIEADPTTITRVNAVYKFVLGSDSWIVDLKNAPGSVRRGTGNADTTLTINEADFINLMTGKLSGQTAFMEGKLKVQGNMANAMKLSQLTQRPKL